MTSPYRPNTTTTTTDDHAPQLPPGTSTTLRGISENFSFHASPESFIASRIAQWQKTDPDALNRRMPIRAKILNRNVVVVSSYRQIRAVLEATGLDGYGDFDSEGVGEPPFVAATAYRELMDEFFPPPNVLLADGCVHARIRESWQGRMEGLHRGMCGVESPVVNIVRSFFEDRSCVPLGQSVDLYETMKSLAWRILLGVFLGLSVGGKGSLFDEVQGLHEELLRGQFSLLPISVNALIWRSPRSKGVRARKKLQDFISWRVHESVHETGGDVDGCLLDFLREGGHVGAEEIRDHVLMMTSSLAVKGLASLLTALFLNLFLFTGHDVKAGEHLAGMVENGKDEVRKHIRSVCLETERLSPPIVGIMRRTTRDMVLEGGHGQPSTLLAKGWDVWLYFVGGGRDPAVFGESCMTFDPERYLGNDTPDPLGFGAGPKTCLGKNSIRDMAHQIAEYCVMSGLSIEGNISSPGLKGWLGWQAATPAQWAADMKQLPTQHPTKPVLVRFIQR